MSICCLSVEKSWWYLVEYIWKRGEWVANDANPGVDLIATSSAGELVSLKRLQAHNTSKILGVWVAPDGNNTTIIKEKNASIEQGDKVGSGKSSRQDAW